MAELTVFNRTDLTKRLIAKLKHEEAVVAGIGNTNFDLFAAGHRPQIFICSAAWGWRCRSRSAWRSRSPSVA